MLKRLQLQIRAMGFTFYLPLIGYFLFIPLLAYVINLSIEDVEERMYTIEELCYQFVPMLSLLWLCMFHKEYVQGEGREILILGKGILAMSFVFWLMNIPCLYLQKQFFHHSDNLFQEMVVISFMLCGLLFFLNFVLNNVSLSLLVIMLYIMLSNVDVYNFLALNNLEQPDRYYKYFFSILSEGGGFSETAQGYIVAGILFWLIGMYKAKRL